MSLAVLVVVLRLRAAGLRGREELEDVERECEVLEDIVDAVGKEMVDVSWRCCGMYGA